MITPIRKKIKLLLPALITNKEQEKMTDLCRKSLVSQHNLEVFEDDKRYDAKVAGVWNAFIDKWRGKEYDYLFIVANDTIADPNAIDFMVKCLEDNLEAGLATGKVVRDIKKFNKRKGKIKYTTRLTQGLIDPACFIIRKGVMEKIGRVDEFFPVEFVERDLIYRIKLAGDKVIQPDIVLWYHPPFSGTVGNDQKRLRQALRKYVYKWGGDANSEQWEFPKNDMNLNYDYCER